LVPIDNKSLLAKHYRIISPTCTSLRSAAALPGSVDPGRFLQGDREFESPPSSGESTNHRFRRFHGLEITKEKQRVSEALARVDERVTFHNNEYGFCVLHVKARGQRARATITA
jgi:hypothetical protein